jgi:hypothetical protein
MAKSGIQSWADTLDNLLGEAAVAAQSEDTAAIVVVQTKLREFTLASPDYADPLDEQARGAIFDLDLGVATQAVARIKQRAAEVRRLSNLIAGVASEANANASILSGEVAKQAIDAATEAVSSFKKLRDGLSEKDPDEKALAKEIDTLLAAVQKIRNQIEVA